MARRKAFFTLMAAAALILRFPATVSAADGTLIKASGPAVYYALDGKRYVFPNEKTYFSWYHDFSGVQTVSDAELADDLIAGNVTYRPSARLVKIQSDPKVYAVSAGGALRWIASEDAARALYGADWNHRVDDISDAFFVDYRLGDPIMSSADYDFDQESRVTAIADDLAFRQGATAPASAGETLTAKKPVGEWSDPLTWGGKAPAAGDDIVIPAGMKVIYDATDAVKLHAIEIDGTLELWSRTSVRLASRLIKVQSGGVLAVGSENAPYPIGKTASILLTGAAVTPDGSEGLRVDGGTLDLHGAAPAVAWTRLAAPAFAGGTRLALAAAVDWKAGDTVVIASTSSRQEEAETRSVVSSDGATLTLDAPLSFDHRSDASLQAEVADLTRNVTVSGVGAGQGSEIVVSHGATARIGGTAFAGLGRSGVPGDEALRFDDLTDGSASYVRGSVVTASGNRCIEIRQTDRLSVEDVVGYDVVGSCFATEDGVETKNVIHRDLAVRVKAAGQSTGDDVPAAFRIRNPDNALSGDAAAGSDGYGFWYDLPQSATRLNGVKANPRETDLGTFDGAAAHSSAKSGLFVDSADGKMNYTPDAKASFTGYRGALNGDAGFSMRGSNLEVSSATLAENHVGGTFAAFGAVFRDSTVIGNPDAASSTPTSRFGFVFQEGPVSVTGVTFRNFVGSSAVRASALTFKDADDRVPDPRSGFRALTLVNAKRWSAAAPSRAGDKQAVARDLESGKAIITRSPFLEDGCLDYLNDGVQACDGAYAQLSVAVRDIGDVSSVTFGRVDGGAAVTLPVGASFDGQYGYANVIEGKAYRVAADASRSLTLGYDGVSKPIVVRLRGSEQAQVRSGVDVWNKVGLDALAPDAWAYDAATGEIVIEIAPGDSATVSW